MEKRWFGLAAVVLAWMVVLVALLCAAEAVAASPAQAPTVDEVAPSSAPNDLDTTIVITGSGFVAVPTVSLNGTMLEQVGWVSAERLTATVPWGLEPGAYALENRGILLDERPVIRDPEPSQLSQRDSNIPPR